MKEMNILVITFGVPTKIKRIGTPQIFNKMFFETEEHSALKAFNDFKEICDKNGITIKSDISKIELISNREFNEMYE